MAADIDNASNRVLGIDFGTVRVGIAVSNSNLTVATPHSIINRLNAIDTIKSISHEYQLNKAVVGIPIHNSNNIQPIGTELFRRILDLGLTADSSELIDLKTSLSNAKPNPPLNGSMSTSGDSEKLSLTNTGKDKAVRGEKDFFLDIFEFAVELVESVHLIVKFYDEKFTSKIAKSAGKINKVPDKKQKGRLDDLAATIMLQGWLDSIRP